MGRRIDLENAGVGDFEWGNLTNAQFPIPNSDPTGPQREDRGNARVLISNRTIRADLILRAPAWASWLENLTNAQFPILIRRDRSLKI
jgi:hypothetical protein